jgi:hypothetical protein
MITVGSDSNAKMRTIETTLEHIAHAVADEYLKCDIKNGHKDFKPMKMMNSSPSHQNSDKRKPI